MKNIVILLLAVLLTACQSTQEPQKETVTVYKTEYVKGVPFVPPAKPKPLMELPREPRIHVLTPETLGEYYRNSIAKSELTEGVKTSLLSQLDNVTKVAMSSQPFVFIGYTKEDYFLAADILNDMTRYIKEVNANRKAIESLNLTIVPEEESSGTNLTN